EDLGDLLEAVAQTRALAGGDLQQRPRAAAARAAQDVIEAARDAGQARLLAGAHVGPGMHDRVRYAEGVAPPQLLHEALPAPGQEVGDDAAEVDEIGRVGEHGLHAAAVEGGAEGAGLARRHGLGLPLPLAAREDLDGRRLDAAAVAGGHRHAAGGGHVRAQQHQVRTAMRPCPTRRKKRPLSSSRCSSSVWCGPRASSAVARPCRTRLSKRPLSRFMPRASSVTGSTVPSSRTTRASPRSASRTRLVTWKAGPSTSTFILWAPS